MGVQMKSIYDMPMSQVDALLEPFADKAKLLLSDYLIAFADDVWKVAHKQSIDVMRDVVNLAIENRPDDEHAEDFDARLNRLQVIIQEWDNA